MRTGKFEFYGKEYLVCMSNLVTTRMETQHIKLEELDKSDAPVSTVLRVLSFMIEAGDAYAKLIGMENPGVLTYEQLCVGLDVGDLIDIVHLIRDVVQGERHVEADPPKKAGAPGA